MTLTKDEIAAGIARLEKGFMTPETCYAPHAIKFEDKRGETFYDLDGTGGDAFRETDGACNVVKARGWYCRLSASGYMDCTDWDGPFTSQLRAEEHLVETHDDGNDDDAEETNDTDSDDS